MFAVVFHHAALPEFMHHLDHLVGDLAALPEVHPIDVEFLLHPADADTEDDAVTAEHRERGGGPRHLVGVAQRQYEEQGHALVARQHGHLAQVALEARVRGLDDVVLPL